MDVSRAAAKADLIKAGGKAALGAKQDGIRVIRREQP